MGLITGGPPVRWSPMGEAAVIFDFGDRIDLDILRQVWALADFLVQRPLHGQTGCIPAYTTVTVFIDPVQTDIDRVGNQVEQLLSQLESAPSVEPQVVDIPVCYGGEFGPDLAFVASHNGLTTDAVIDIHSRAEYLVYMIGFVPGFPYLGGMSPRIATPRLETPRLVIPVGSVGIGGDQTGIYPLSTPGGWRLIGRTPLELFQPTRTPPSLLQAGDRVRFYPITPGEFGV